MWRRRHLGAPVPSGGQTGEPHAAGRRSMTVLSANTLLGHSSQLTQHIWPFEEVAETAILPNWNEKVGLRPTSTPLARLRHFPYLHK